MDVPLLQDDRMKRWILELQSGDPIDSGNRTQVGVRASVPMLFFSYVEECSAECPPKGSRCSST